MAGVNPGMVAARNDLSRAATFKGAVAESSVGAKIMLWVANKSENLRAGSAPISAAVAGIAANPAPILSLVGSLGSILPFGRCSAG